MYIVYRIVSVGAAALAGILPITAPEPQVVNPISAVISQNATQSASISGTPCKKVGQIRDFQAQRFICLKVNAKAGSSNGPSLVWVKISSPKSTTKSTTTTVRIPSTTVKKTCQDGGTCKIGDRGPGGGFVFYDNPDKASAGGKYLEVSPSCVNYSHYPADKIQLDGIAKFPNNYKPSCPWFSNYQVLAAVDAYYTETKDD